MIRPFYASLLSVGLLAACVSPQDQGALIGAAGGAAVGAAVSSDDDRTKGALVGAALGAVAGNLIGQANTPGQCRYRDSYGREFIAACP